MPTRQLDVDRTLRASIANAGFFSPVFATRNVSPEYLILIDRVGSRDHVGIVVPGHPGWRSRLLEQRICCAEQARGALGISAGNEHTRNDVQ